MPTTHDDNPCETLTVVQAARQIGVSNDFLLELIRRGQFPAVRVPGTGRRATGRLLILKRDVTAALHRWRDGGDQ